MFNLKIGKNSILNEVEDYNFTARTEDETGVCIEVNDNGLEVALDDSDWSEFMSSNGAEFLNNDDEAYYYKVGDNLVSIPVDSVSDDNCDVFLDINNVNVCSIDHLALSKKSKNKGDFDMKIYCNLKLKGIDNEMDFNKNFTGFNRILNLDDIHFVVPNPKESGEDYVNVHLDFDDMDGHFVDGEFIVRLKGLADTWNELNLEDGLNKDDITIELLKKGSLENYVMFFNKDNGEVFTDITITKIGYMNEENQEICFQIDKDAVNEA